MSSLTKICAFISTALALSGCDIRVQELQVEKKAEESCHKFVQISSEQSGKAAIGQLEAMDFMCVPPIFDSLARYPYDQAVARAAISFLDRLGLQQRRKTDPAQSLAALAVLTYLTQNAGKDSALGFRLSTFAGPIRGYVEVGLGEEAIRATNLLSILKDEQDIKLFSRNVHGKSDALLAVSLFALAQNCSDVAASELRTLLGSERVVGYLKKHEGKESVSSTVSRDCPAATRTEKVPGSN